MALGHILLSQFRVLESLSASDKVDWNDHS